MAQLTSHATQLAEARDAAEAVTRAKCVFKDTATPEIYTLSLHIALPISWRRFCRIPLDRPVPHPTTLSKLAHRCGPGVTAQLNAALLAKLAADKLLRGRKLRIDTTVMAAS